MKWYSFWIRDLVDINKKIDMKSAKKINIEAFNYYEAMIVFMNQYGFNYETCINGLSNSDKIIDLQGKTVTINCLAIKIINQITIRNGTLFIIPQYESIILRSNLDKVIIGLKTKNNAKLIISNTNCQGSFFIGENICFNGPISGEYIIMNNKRKKKDLSTMQLSKEKKEKKLGLSPEEYEYYATKLGTKDITKIIEAYNKLKL